MGMSLIAAKECALTARLRPCRGFEEAQGLDWDPAEAPAEGREEGEFIASASRPQPQPR